MLDRVDQELPEDALHRVGVPVAVNGSLRREEDGALLVGVRNRIDDALEDELEVDRATIRRDAARAHTDEGEQIGDHRVDARRRAGDGDRLTRLSAAQLVLEDPGDCPDCRDGQAKALLDAMLQPGRQNPGTGHRRRSAAARR